jgi:predicted DNA-binding ribbon-helix-helix protein
MIRRSIYLPDGHWLILQQWAAAKGLTPSLAVERLIQQLVNGRGLEDGRREPQAR